jgi:hypothetical protein
MAEARRKRSRGTGGDADRVDEGVDGARVTPGQGESASNLEDIERAVKIYNTGVVAGHLTLSRGNDWADTMANCEDAVASIDFWGQIATHLSSMEYRAGTAINYFNKLFNLAKQHFYPAGLAVVGTAPSLPFSFPSFLPSLPFLPSPCLRCRAVPGPVPGKPGTMRIFWKILSGKKIHIS